MSIKLNLASNFVGSVWNAAITLLVTPIQVSLLGISEFGLLSSIAVIQVVVSALDFGLSAVATRVLALRGEKGGIAEIIRPAVTIYWIFAFLILGAGYYFSPIIAKIFFESENLTMEVTVLYLRLIVVFIVIRWPIALYVAILSGLHSFNIINGIRSACLTLRLLVGVLLLLIFPNFLTLIYWYIFTAIVELLLFIYFASSQLPLSFFGKPYFAVKELVTSWHFSAQMYGISILAILLTQLDRIFISSMLGLESLGYYSLAYGLAIGLSLIQTAINGVAIPALTSAFGAGSKDQLAIRYEKFSQIMSVAITPFAMILIFFSQPILAVWVGPDLAEKTHQTLTFLSIGFIFGSVVSSVFTLTIACGEPGLCLKVNIIGVIIFIPILVFALSWYGYIGGAYAWVCLNLYYLIFFLPMAHKKLLIGSTRVWAKKNLLPFIVAGLFSFYVGLILYGFMQNIVGLLFALSFSMLIYVLLAYHALSKELKNDLSFIRFK